MSEPGRYMRSILLMEPQFLLRRTVASVARELGLGRIVEATSVDAAKTAMAVRCFDGLLVDLDDEGAAFELISQVRQGNTQCDANLPVAAFAATCDASMVLNLKQLEVRRVLLKPFKVKAVLDSIVGLWPAEGA